jgi:hypothetical protein
MWLLKRLTPDFNTIADFRRDNRLAIRQVCRQFTVFCQQLDLFGGELVAIYGSKFKAQNAKGRSFTQAKLKRQLKALDKQIDQYLPRRMRQTRRKKTPPHKPKAEQLREKIEAMQRRQTELRERRQQMKDSGRSQLSRTDPDSRSMPVGGGEASIVGYNVQLSVDAKHKLIVDHEVANDVTDFGLLSDMAKGSRQALAVEHLDVVSDMGYYDGH